MPFYKRDPNNTEHLHVANVVVTGAYTLSAQNKDEFTYPHDGWYWFANMDEALRNLPLINPPQKITLRQARLALLDAGLLDMVEAALQSIEDPDMKKRALIEWEYANDVERTSPWINTLASKLGMTEEQLDNLFLVGASL